MACDFDDEDGPDVALVLSGGGALTATQVGAMQIIEDAGVPIHCVLGTSMGSVTGAMYVAGYSPDEIAMIYSERNWGEIFRGETRRSDKPYLQKEAGDEYFSDYFAGIGPEGVKLPGGLSSMSGLQYEFREILDHIPNRSDFTRDFRVPYRSIAMDLSTGDAIAFESGDLVQTILASMAVPGAFAPRAIEGEQYVDGGMAAQLPVRFAKEMGADIVIAIDTTFEPSRLDGSPSLTSTTSQLIQIIVHRNRTEDVALLQDGDLLISPDLTGLSSSNFNTVDQGFKSGQAEAKKYIQRLQEIAAVAAPARDRKIDPNRDLGFSGEIKIANASSIDDQIILDRLNLQDTDLSDKNAVEDRLRDLFSFGAFGDIDLARSIDGFLVSTTERAIGRNLLQGGFRASTTFDGDSQYSLLGRISRRPLGASGGEASLSFELGSDYGATLQYYRPFGSEGRYFFAPAIGIRGEEVLLDFGENRFGEFFERSLDARLRMGREISDWGVVSIEAVASTGDIETIVSVRPDLITGTSYEQAGAKLFLGVDTLNKTVWPTSGIRVLASGEIVRDFDADVDVTTSNLAATFATSYDDLGINLRVQAETIEEDRARLVNLLQLGGFRRISALAEGAIPNNGYVLATGEAFYRLTGTENIVNFPFYVGGTIEYAAVDVDFFEPGRTEDLLAGSLYLGGETALGPLYLGAGFGEQGNTSIFLHFGRAF